MARGWVEVLLGVRREPEILSKGLFKVKCKWQEEASGKSAADLAGSWGKGPEVGMSTHV